MASLPTGTVTLLFTDIEGSTRLWESNPAAMKAGLARHDALLRQCIAGRGGEVFKTGGDAFCAAFAVAADAVAAALDAQRALAHEPWPGGVPLRARMALHTGAVELREGDYFGAAVSRVARMVAAAHGGQTLLSESTHQLCRDQLPAMSRIAALGPHAFKDLGRDEPVFQLAHPDLAPSFPPLRTEAVPAMAAERDTPSIAVLPFVNMSQDEDNAYFADGLSEELLNVLAKIRGLRVASRTSAFSFKGSNVDIPTIARKLNVRTVLEGSVRKAGKRVRVTAQLIEVETDSHLWSESYDRDLDDIFAVQDDIAQSVVTELRGLLLGAASGVATAAPPVSAQVAAAAADVQRASVGRTENAEAFELYLKAKALTGRMTQQDSDQAIALLTRALEIDPQFALAWAQLAGFYLQQAGYGFAPIDVGHKRAREIAQKAIDIEPNLAAGHLVMGRVQMLYDWDWAATRRSLDRAMALAPNDAEVMMSAGTLAGVQGRPEEYVALVQRAVKLDPLSPATHARATIGYYVSGRIDDAITEARVTLQMDPARALARPVLAILLVMRGELAAAQQVLDDGPQHPVFHILACAMVAWARGERAQSDAHKKALVDQYAWTASYQIATLCAWREETDETFHWLDTSFEHRDPGTLLLVNDPVFEPMRRDPRWKGLLARLKLLPGDGA